MFHQTANIFLRKDISKPLFYFILFYFVKVLKGTLTLKLRRQPMDRYKNNQDPPPQEFPQFLNYLKQTCSVVVLF